MTHSHISQSTSTHLTNIQRGDTGQALRAQDETNGVKELTSLAELGITAIDYANGRYEYDSGLRLSGVASGQISYASAETVTLQAQQEGVKYSPVGAGIKIDTTDGPPVIVITQVESEAAVFAGLTLTTQGETIGGTDGALLYEDGLPYSYNPDTQGAVTLTLTQAQLLANDTWHGLTGAAAGLQEESFNSFTIKTIAVCAHFTGAMGRFVHPNTFRANFSGTAGANQPIWRNVA